MIFVYRSLPSAKESKDLGLRSSLDLQVIDKHLEMIIYDSLQDNRRILNTPDIFYIYHDCMRIAF